LGQTAWRVVLATCVGPRIGTVRRTISKRRCLWHIGIPAVGSDTTGADDV
jgi:hypothetical protein